MAWVAAKDAVFFYQAQGPKLSKRKAFLLAAWSMSMIINSMFKPRVLQVTPRTPKLKPPHKNRIT